MSDSPAASPTFDAPTPATGTVSLDTSAVISPGQHVSAGEPVVSDATVEKDGAAACAGHPDSPLKAPVAQAIRYRKRAQAAEQQLSNLQERVTQLQTELDQARRSASRLERRQQIDAMLAQAEAVDVQVARLLTESAVEMMDEPDLKLVIDDLRRHKPYLFRRKSQPTATTMSPRLANASVSAHAEQAAQQAVATGSRRDVLRYLRMRRTAR